MVPLVQPARIHMHAAAYRIVQERMASKFTVNSLAAGGKWGRPTPPGRIAVPPPRGRGMAPTGGDFAYENDPGRMGNYELKKGEAQYVPDANVPDFLGDEEALKWKWAIGASEAPYASDAPVSSIKEVHKSDLIGYRTFTAAEALDRAVDAALQDYMSALRKAYTFSTKDQGNLCALDEFTTGERQPIVRKYLAVKLAVRDLLEQRTDEASIEAPGGVLTFQEGGFGDLTPDSDLGEDGTCSLRSASRATLCCIIFSVSLGVGSLVVSGLFHAWGSDVYAGVDPIGLSKFWDGSFWGWPSQAVFRNIYCGLMLGVVFGFLDNFGLFYGTSALDGTFYSLGNKIASGLLADSPEGRYIADPTNFGDNKYTTEVALAAHQITEDMMSGLGNTFSCARAPAPLTRAPLTPAPLTPAPSAPQRSPGRRARHRRARDCQGRARRRALVVARRPRGHRAGLPPRRLPARARQVRRQARPRHERLEEVGSRTVHPAHLRVGADRRHPGRHEGGRARHGHREHRDAVAHPLLPGLLHPPPPAAQVRRQHAAPAVGRPPDARARPECKLRATPVAEDVPAAPGPGECEHRRVADEAGDADGRVQGGAAWPRSVRGGDR